MLKWFVPYHPCHTIQIFTCIHARVIYLFIQKHDQIIQGIDIIELIFTCYIIPFSNHYSECCWKSSQQFFSYIHGVKKKLLMKYDDDVCFLLDPRCVGYLYNTSSLKQHSTGRPVAPLRHIILIPSQTFLFLLLKAALYAENKQILIILYRLTRPVLEPTIDLSRPVQ